jgi:hypothetical protein
MTQKRQIDLTGADQLAIGGRVFDLQNTEDFVPLLSLLDELQLFYGVDNLGEILSPLLVPEGEEVGRAERIRVTIRYDVEGELLHSHCVRCQSVGLNPVTQPFLPFEVLDIQNSDPERRRSKVYL